MNTIASWLKQVDAMLRNPEMWFFTVTDDVEAKLCLAAVLSLVGFIALVIRRAFRPVPSRRWKTAAVLVALALAVMPFLMIYVGKPNGQHLLLNPLELLVMLRMFFFLGIYVPAVHLFSPEVMYRFMATCAFVLMPMGLCMLMAFDTKRRGVQFLVVGFILVLAILPVKNLADRYAQASARIKERAAEAVVFDARCKLAGATRLREVHGVDGIRLTGLRNETTDEASFDRDWAEAGIANDRVGKEYVASYLDFKFMDDRLSGSVTMTGYRYVDVLQSDGSYLRYSLVRSARGLLPTAEKIAPEQAARYAVDYARDELPHDREHWVAGATVTVSDTQTGEVLGELKSFSHVPPSRYDELRGPGRRSWRGAKTCPDYKETSSLYDVRTRMFVDQVIHRQPL